MRDTFGRLLTVGDEALYFYLSGQRAVIKRVIITGFTNKMVRWQVPGDAHYREEGTTMPHKMVLQPPGADVFGTDRREEDQHV